MMAALQSLELPVDSPPVLLAQEEQLKLTAEQKARLTEIAELARQQAREVLDDEQRAQLADVPAGGLSPMQLARMLTKEKNTGQQGGQGNQQGGQGQMCPMCKQMMHSQGSVPLGTKNR